MPPQFTFVSPPLTTQYKTEHVNQIQIRPILEIIVSPKSDQIKINYILFLRNEGKIMLLLFILLCKFQLKELSSRYDLIKYLQRDHVIPDTKRTHSALNSETHY